MFNEIVAEEKLSSSNVALQALRRLTAAFGARALIMDELMQMKKTRAMIVREYARNFRKLLPLLGKRPVPEADLTCRFKTGMLIDWQLELNRHARTWDLARMVTQFEAIDRHKMEAELLRGGRLNVGKESSKTSKRSLLEDAVRT
ncbi:hypothetical protein PI126_g18547 [Phytophthora idaei]|nr:hypothetical protein PI126_g18547 [Phytophthora idaei]